jgi:hypothetical protein
LCIYRSDSARCQGDRAKVGVNTCLGCKNFIVGPRHLGFWQDRRDEMNRFGASMPEILLTPERRAALEDEVRKAEKIISLIDMLAK